MNKFKLGEVFMTTSGGTPSRRNLNYYNGSIPWVKSGELKSNIILDTEEKISEEAIKNSSAKIFPKGTLLIALYGATIGKLAKLGIDAATNQAVCGIFENNEHDLDYLYWYLFYKRRKLIEAGIGGAQPNINQTILKNLEIPLPEKKIQQAIVSKIEELFSELDNGIEQLKTAQQQLKTYQQSVLKCAFDGRLTNESIKEGEFPKEWKWTTLGEICDPKRKCSYGVLVPGDHVENGVTLLRVGDINEKGLIDQTKIKKISPTIASKFKRTFLEGGEIVISLVGRIGSTAVVPDSLKGANTARAVGVIPVSKDVSAKFIEAMLRSPNKIREHNNSSHEVARKTLNLEDVVKSKIPLPSIEEQNNIVQQIERRLSVADKMEESITQSLQQAEALRQSVLKKAFEGNLI
jgi:type I restriction enzyme, S subunit